MSTSSTTPISHKNGLNGAFDQEGPTQSEEAEQQEKDGITTVKPDTPPAQEATRSEQDLKEIEEPQDQQHAPTEWEGRDNWFEWSLQETNTDLDSLMQPVVPDFSPDGEKKRRKKRLFAIHCG
jgi:hypothetical protein